MFAPGTNKASFGPDPPISHRSKIWKFYWDTENKLLINTAPYETQYFILHFVFSLYDDFVNLQTIPLTKLIHKKICKIISFLFSYFFSIPYNLFSSECKKIIFKFLEIKAYHFNKLIGFIKIR